MRICSKNRGQFSKDFVELPHHAESTDLSLPTFLSRNFLKVLLPGSSPVRRIGPKSSNAKGVKTTEPSAGNTGLVILMRSSGCRIICSLRGRLCHRPSWYARATFMLTELVL